MHEILIKDAGYDDIMEALDISKSGQSAKLKIKPEAFKDLVIKYQLNAMTTKAEDNGEKKGAMDDWFGIIQKMPNELQSVRDQGKEINWELVFNMYGQYSGLPELEKVWQDVTPEERAAEQQQLQSESIQPDQPHVDYRIMGDMDPQQVSDVMAQNGTQTPPGQMQPASPQQPGPMTAQPAAPQPAGPQQVPQHPMGARNAVNPPQPVPTPHPLNSSDPRIRQAAEMIQQMTQRR